MLEKIFYLAKKTGVLRLMKHLYRKFISVFGGTGTSIQKIAVVGKSRTISMIEKTRVTSETDRLT